MCNCTSGNPWIPGSMLSLSSGRALRGPVGIARNDGSARGARPGFAAAEHANAAFDSQRVRTRYRNVAGIAVAVVGVVDLPRPSVRARRVHAAEQRKPDHRTSGEGRIGILVVDLRFSGGGVDRV